MLSSASRRVADRLVDTLVALARAVSPAAVAPSRPAVALFERLSRLVVGFIRLAALASSPRRDAAPAERGPCREPSCEPARADDDTGVLSPSSESRLPTRPGWILDLVPEASAIARELRDILADPAATLLLAADPALDRALRPILLGLGLAPVPSPPPSARMDPPATPPGVADRAVTGPVAWQRQAAAAARSLDEADPA